MRLTFEGENYSWVYLSVSCGFFWHCFFLVNRTVTLFYQLRYGSPKPHLFASLERRLPAARIWMERVKWRIHNPWGYFDLFPILHCFWPISSISSTFLSKLTEKLDKKQKGRRISSIPNGGWLSIALNHSSCYSCPTATWQIWQGKKSLSFWVNVHCQASFPADLTPIPRISGFNLHFSSFLMVKIPMFNGEIALFWWLWKNPPFLVLEKIVPVPPWKSRKRTQLRPGARLLELVPGGIPVPGFRFVKGKPTKPTVVDRWFTATELSITNSFFTALNSHCTRSVSSFSSAVSEHGCCI